MEHCSSAALRAQFGPWDYYHIPALGNVNYRGGPIVIADYAAGKHVIEDLRSRARTVVLLCVCADVQTCHPAGNGVTATIARPPASAAA